MDGLEIPIFEDCPAADAIALVQDYHRLGSAADKRAFHQAWVECTEYPKLPRLEDAAGPLKAVVKSALSVLQPTTLNPGRAFEPILPDTTDPGDMLPTGREKFIHTVGATASIQFARDPLRNQFPECSADFEYTGVIGELARGDSATAMIRMAWAGDPRLTFVPLLARQFRLGYLPGIAIKFFLEGNSRSVNALAFSGMEGQLETDNPRASNFFATPVGTAVAKPKRTIGRIVEEFLRVAGKANQPRVLSNLELSTWRSDGTEETDEVVDPFALMFHGTPEAQDVFDADTPGVDARVRFQGLAHGTPLYDIYAKHRESGCNQYLTTIVLDGNVIASAWGDLGLYFRHPVAGQR